MPAWKAMGINNEVYARLERKRYLLGRGSARERVDDLAAHKWMVGNREQGEPRRMKEVASSLSFHLSLCLTERVHLP